MVFINLLIMTTLCLQCFGTVG